MTLINSCWPKSFSHLIFLLTTFTITATTIPSTHNAHIGHDDNKQFDNFFDFKTEVKNILETSHDVTSNLDELAVIRHRRDIRSPASAENLILNLSFANLTTFTNGGDGVVTSLNLSHNFLSHFNASKLSKLKALDVSWNSLTSFGCFECLELEMLNLSHNLLTSVSLAGVGEALRVVDLSANELGEIDPKLFHNKSNLSEVLLACNRITVIDKDLFRQLGSLRRLDLSFNDISDIHSDTFSHLLNLQIFDLSFNRIHIASLQSLQSIPDLTRLSLAGNVLLRNALRGFAVTWSIMELDYSHVGLCQVPDSLAQSVRILNLYGNFVDIICSGDFDSYPLLHKLVLSNNNLTSIEDDALGRLDMLTILYVDNNQLTHIPTSLPASLVKLYMQSNRITDIHADDLINLINLEVLDVSGNNIIYMPQLVLPSLITLSVKSCGLESIHNQLTKTCPNLHQILIDGNLIKCAELMEFESCNENSQSLTDEYINDNIVFGDIDAERRERHTNSISFFSTSTCHDGVGGCDKCRKWNRSKEAVPNCWNEQKLITSFTLTNDSTSTATTVASNDNKFQRQNTHDNVTGTKARNEGNLSSETMKINNNTTIAREIITNEKPEKWKMVLKPEKNAAKAEVGEGKGVQKQQDAAVGGNQVVKIDDSRMVVESETVRKTDKQIKSSKQRLEAEVPKFSENNDLVIKSGEGRNSTVAKPNKKFSKKDRMQSEKIENEILKHEESKATLTNNPEVSNLVLPNSSEVTSSNASRVTPKFTVASKLEVLKSTVASNLTKISSKALQSNGPSPKLLEETSKVPKLSQVTTDHSNMPNNEDAPAKSVLKPQSPSSPPTHPTNVAKTEIKALSIKNISLPALAEHRQKGLNNSILMKTKQIESSLIANVIISSSSTTTPANPKPEPINRNLIDYVNGDVVRVESSSSKLISANKVKAIKDNEGLSSTNNTKSMAGAGDSGSKSRNGHNNSVNGGSLSMSEGNNSESMDATDHQQHTAINHEKWNDIRSETINHPGLLIVITVSTGLLFTFVVVYVYRCNFINSARRRRRRGSCESINEGRDVLNDNFNEESRSFTIEAHSDCGSPLTASPTAINQCDLLPMDILNSTLRQSNDSGPHISMHLW